MAHTKIGDEEMLTDGVFPHSMGKTRTKVGLGSDDHDNSIAAETVYFTAKCTSCSWHGDDYPNDNRPAWDEARQHQIDYPGHSATVESKKAPTA